MRRSPSRSAANAATAVSNEPNASSRASTSRPIHRSASSFFAGPAAWASSVAVQASPAQSGHRRRARPHHRRRRGDGVGRPTTGRGRHSRQDPVDEGRRRGRDARAGGLFERRLRSHSRRPHPRERPEPLGGHPRRRRAERAARPLRAPGDHGPTSARGSTRCSRRPGALHEVAPGAPAPQRCQRRTHEPGAGGLRARSTRGQRSLAGARGAVAPRGPRARARLLPRLTRPGGPRDDGRSRRGLEVAPTGDRGAARGPPRRPGGA